MKKLKEPTIPTACQLSLSMRQKVEEMAELLELSTSQCVAMLIEMGLKYEDSKGFQDSFQEISLQLQLKENELEEMHVLTGLTSPFTKAALQKIHSNDQILNSLFIKYGTSPIPRLELNSMEFNFNVLLVYKVIEGRTYYYMDKYGWANYDQGKTQIIIRKRN